MKDFEKINWLPVSERFNQYLCSNAFNFFKETCPLYFHDICRQFGQNQANTRSSVLKLKHPLKVVSATFWLVCFLSLKESTEETRKNVFYCTSKALFVLEKIKF